MNLNTDERREARERALRRAVAIGSAVFENPSREEHREQADYFQPFHRAQLPTVAALVGALMEAKIYYPEDLVRYLGDHHPKSARVYTQALWGIIDAFQKTDGYSIDWHVYFDQFERGVLLGGDDVNDEEDEGEALKRWTKKVEEQRSLFIGMLDEALQHFEVRANPDLRESIAEMQRDLVAMQEGVMPDNFWQLDLTVTTNFGESGGHRTYAIKLDSEGFGGECYGSEWQKEVGSDSWSGSNFHFSPNDTREEGELWVFTSEFQSACKDTDYEISISLNDESLAVLPKICGKDAEGEKMAQRLLRKIVCNLNKMTDPAVLQSGADSGLKNVWDEICVQRQVEESFAWDAYEACVRGLIEGVVGEINQRHLEWLWVRTPQGQEWLSGRQDASERPVPCADNVVGWIYDRLMSLASDYLNHRIIQYRDRVREE